MYVFLLLYVFLCCFIYSFYLMKTQSENHPIIELVIGGSVFFLLGLVYGNCFHKRGLWIGLSSAIIHFFLIKLIYFLSIGTFSMHWFVFFINVILAGIGGILGTFFKKIF